MRDFQRRLKEAPLTALLVGANVALFLLWVWALVYEHEAVASTVVQLSQRPPWSAVSFMLLEPTGFFDFGTAMLPVVLVLVFWMGGDLEKKWGSATYGLFVLGSSAAAYLAVYYASGHTLTGPAPVLANLVMAYTVVFSWYRQRVMYMFTLTGTFFRLTTLLCVYLSAGLYASYVPSLAALAAPLLSWWWATRLTREPQRLRLAYSDDDEYEPEYEELEEESPAPPDPAELEIDRILDKISTEGMAALTPAEREVLDSRSRSLRERDR